MNIVMIGPFPQDATQIRGGVQASVYGLSKALSANHHVVGISLPTTRREKKYVGSLDHIAVNYLNAPLGFLFSSVLYLPRILRIIRAQPNRIVHLHSTGLTQLLVLLTMRILRIPCIWTLHGITEIETRQQFEQYPTYRNYLRHEFYRNTERAMLKLARTIIVDTDYVKAQLPSASANIQVIPQGIFLDEFAAMRGLPRETPHIVSLGVIDERKGHHLTIQAFAKLRETMPDAQLTIAGALKNAAYLYRLHEQIATLELRDAVHIVYDVPRETMLALLAQARLFALHSREESQGIALCEALAAGLPVVATNVGGIPHVVTQNMDGLLSNYGDVDTFANALQSLLCDTALYQRMAIAAKTSATRFDWQQIANSIAALYAAEAA